MDVNVPTIGSTGSVGHFVCFLCTAYTCNGFETTLGCFWRCLAEKRKELGRMLEETLGWRRCWVSFALPRDSPLGLTLDHCCPLGLECPLQCCCISLPRCGWAFYPGRWWTGQTGTSWPHIFSPPLLHRLPVVEVSVPGAHLRPRQLIFCSVLFWSLQLLPEPVMFPFQQSSISTHLWWVSSSGHLTRLWGVIAMTPLFFFLKKACLKWVH